MDYLKLFLLLGLIFFILCRKKESFRNYQMQMFMNNYTFYKDYDSSDIIHDNDSLYKMSERMNKDDYLLELEEMVCHEPKYCPPTPS